MTIHDLFAKIYGLPRPPRSVRDVLAYFKALKSGVSKGELIATELASLLAYKVCRKEIYKSHVSAKNLETFLGAFLGGIISSPKSRPSVPVPSPPANSYLVNARDFLSGVRRAALEKTDLYFPPPSKLRFSLKSLVPENPEINIGSFPQRLLFMGFLKVVPNERKGLGSAKRLRAVLEDIERRGLWDAFVKRFSYMVDAIFNGVHLLVVERDPSPRITIYLVESPSFRNLLKSAAREGPSRLTEVVYRYELHSLRVKKKPIVNLGVKLEIPLVPYSSSPLIRLEKAVEDLYYNEFLTGIISLETFINKVEKLFEEFVETLRKGAKG